MRKAILGVGWLVLCGCATTGPRDAPYEDYYEVMSDRQRVEFATLRTEDERQDYVQQQGLDVAVFLNRNLRRGMTEVAVREILKDPRTMDTRVEETPRGSHVHTTLYYEIFNGVANDIVYSVHFTDDSLVGWTVWKDEW